MSPSISLKVLQKGKLRHGAWSPFAEDQAEPQLCRDEHKLIQLFSDIHAPHLHSGERGRGQAVQLAGTSMACSSYKLNTYPMCFLHPEAAAVFALPA